jgi:hypothetical protein
VLTRKWELEVEADVDRRKAAGLPPLMRRAWIWRMYVDPIFVLRYRHRIFRDDESRRRLLDGSYGFPIRGLMDPQAPRAPKHARDDPPALH